MGTPHPLFCVGGAEVGPRWDRGGTVPPTFLYEWDRGGTEVGPPHPRFIGWDRPTPFGVYKIKKREGWGAVLAGWERRIGPNVTL